MRWPVPRLSEFTVFACCIPLAAVTANALPQAQTPGTTPQVGARVSGILVDAEGLSQAGREILLVEVRLIDLEGKEIKRLPPKGTFIVDRPDSGAVTRAEASGMFEFKNVSAGRYSVCVRSKPDGTPRGGGLIHLEHDGNTVFFDVAVGGDIDVGSVSEKRKQP